MKNSPIWKTISTSRWLSISFLQFFHMKKQVVFKLFIHVHFKWVEKYYVFLLIEFHTSPSKKNTNHFSRFSFSHQTYTTKTPSSSKFTLDYHSSITQIQPYSKIWEEYHIDNPYPIGSISIKRKRLKIMKMTVSWKRFNNRIEEDFEEENLFEDWIRSTCAMFHIWSWVWYDISKFYRI